jgi:hypothetical protein
MINRESRTEFMDKLLSAGTLLSLCALIALGPRPQQIVSRTQTTVQAAGRNPNESTFLNDASETIRQTSAENQNP